MNSAKKLMVVGNWKMHLTVQQSSLLLHRLQVSIATHRNVEVVLAPTMLALQPLSRELDRRKFRLAAQDAYYVDEGDYTGEVSFAMLHDMVHYCIIGHSARRIYFNETLDMIRDKVQAAIRNDINPIVCIGETRREHAARETKQVIHDQLTTALMNVTSQDLKHVVLVYEPTWAITSFDGIIAKPAEVAETVAYMRLQMAALFGDAAAKAIRILYGGSVDDHAVASYLELDGVDGVLVGAASLNYHAFTKIVETAHAVQTRVPDMTRKDTNSAKKD
jgi:triosephosphate isomerase